jgi:hypothetical protein
MGLSAVRSLREEDCHAYQHYNDSADAEFHKCHEVLISFDMRRHVHVFIRVGLVDIHRQVLPVIRLFPPPRFGGHLHKFQSSPSVEVFFSHAKRAALGAWISNPAVWPSERGDVLQMTKFAHGKGSIQRTLLALGLGTVLMGTALADADTDKQKLAQCAKDICGIIVSKNASGPDLSCQLTKSWEKDEIQKGADSKKMSWGLGSAKCGVKVNVKRAEIVVALTSPEKTLKIDKQSIACEIGEKYPVSATMAPELKMKDGKNTGVSLHINDIKGEALIKGAVWTAATLEQNFGILEGDMVREVNRFIQKECPKILGDAK